MFLVNDFVSTKKKTTFLVPSEFADAFEELAKAYGEKKKWWVHTAAVLLLLEQSPETIAELVGRVAGAEPGKSGGSYARLIETAKLRAGEGGRTKANIRGGEGEPLPKIRGTITKGGKTTRVE